MQRFSFLNKKDHALDDKTGTPGGAALVLVGTLIAQLSTRGLADVAQMETALRLLLERPVTLEQREDTLNAIGVLEGIRARARQG